MTQLRRLRRVILHTHSYSLPGPTRGLVHKLWDTLSFNNSGCSFRLFPEPRSGVPGIEPRWKTIGTLNQIH